MIPAAPRSPGVSVVVPHYGDPAPTLALLGRIREQTWTGPLQVIVSDDASPVPLPAPDPSDGVEVVRRERNGGFGSAVNSGAALARHELLLVLNSDLGIGRTFVADLVAAAEPWQPAVVSPAVVGHDGATQWAGRHFPTVGHQVVEWLTPLARFRHTRAWHENVGHDTAVGTGGCRPVDWVMGAAMLIPTTEFRAVGGFDERYFMNAEEVDLQRRLRDRGVPSVVAASVTAEHEGGGSSDPQRRRQWLVDARFRYARKWGGARRLRAALTAATVVNFLVNTLRQLKGTDVDARAVLRQELGCLGRRTRGGAA
ncbi:glycosyltransferase family 2 protein [Kocuria sp. M1R5S2]|uniref:glycosyltransferase family 2 protein n=1 Tax=Kocuria rhizosphaerae TaxID=3376285 RepID=UPI0037A95D99